MPASFSPSASRVPLTVNSTPPRSPRRSFSCCRMTAGVTSLRLPLASALGGASVASDSSACSRRTSCSSSSTSERSRRSLSSVVSFSRGPSSPERADVEYVLVDGSLRDGNFLFVDWSVQARVGFGSAGFRRLNKARTLDVRGQRRLSKPPARIARVEPFAVDVLTRGHARLCAAARRRGAGAWELRVRVRVALEAGRDEIEDVQQPMAVRTSCETSAGTSGVSYTSGAESWRATRAKVSAGRPGRSASGDKQLTMSGSEAYFELMLALPVC